MVDRKGLPVIVKGEVPILGRLGGLVGGLEGIGFLLSDPDEDNPFWFRELPAVGLCDVILALTSFEVNDFPSSL